MKKQAAFRQRWGLSIEKKHALKQNLPYQLAMVDSIRALKMLINNGLINILDDILLFLRDVIIVLGLIVL